MSEHKSYEAAMLLEERDYWRQRALQAEGMTQALSQEKFDPKVIAMYLGAHINDNASFQSNSYRKALLYVRDITSLLTSQPSPPDDVVNVLRRLNNNISITLARFGDDELTSKQNTSSTQQEHST